MAEDDLDPGPFGENSFSCSSSYSCPPSPSSLPPACISARQNYRGWRSLKIDYMMGDLRSLIGESLEGANRVNRIVQDLKNFARVDESERIPADINQCVESTLNIVWNELKYKASVEREYGALPLIPCNSGQLSQVFMNLLVNAAQAIEGSGTITIRTRHDGPWLYIIIEDTGSGIHRPLMGRIFEPFFTTKEVGKGTGLGLSIAYEIVKKHGGQIEVESERGRGTKFSITLPVGGAP